jgi:hypothetical protein
MSSVASFTISNRGERQEDAEQIVQGLMPKESACSIEPYLDKQI